MPTARDIYDDHSQAFKSVSAYVILKDGDLVARVAIKTSTSGLRVTAYVHWMGSKMVKGTASGGGYDRASAAVADAARKITCPEYAADRIADREAFTVAAAKDSGKRWDDQIRDAGFTVFQAV